MMKKKVLIVDDVASNIHMLSLMLKEDYSIVAAKTGEKAIELANKNPKPDIILLDLLMPGLNGYDVCRILKENQETTNIPIVFVSSLDDIQEQKKALAIGGNDYLVKPVTKDILLTKLDTQIKLSLYNTNATTLYQETFPLKDDKKPTVLIVDDVPQNIQIAVEILKDKYAVSVATSGEKAISLLDEGLHPDIILLDIVMPDIDGFNVCKTLKSNSKYCNIPIIFLTILENEFDMVKGLELGAVDYVTKPFEAKVLKARVDTHIRLKMYQDKLIENIREKDDILIRQSKLAILGEMFENITHQWKQPLSVISMISATIKFERDNGVLDDKSLDDLLYSVDTSVTHLSDTIDSFRDFLIRDNPKEYFNVKQVVENTLVLLDSKLKYDKIQININLDDSELFNYKNDFIQVLMNLFSNSIHVLKDQQKDKKINIDFVEENENFILSISDNGGGIDQTIITKIFDKYFSTKEDGSSSGLGLYMSKKIIEDNMKGKLQVNSVGDEAIFKISLPLVHS